MHRYHLRQYLAPVFVRLYHSSFEQIPGFPVRSILLVVASCLLFPFQSFANFDAQNDLVALHFDHAPDRDDGHAAVAALVVVESLQLNAHVVGGTYGRWNADRYVPASEAVMDSVWGNNWYNAHSDYNGSLNATAERWIQTLDAGSDVWVAEGGQADFTADLVRLIQRDRPAVETAQRIHIVQHSDWNEVHADQSDLNFVRANTDYMLIDDGNFSNATADLNQKSQSFVDTVQSSAYASAWQAAFSYLSPDEKLDFSDTVELLHIVGVDTNEVKSPDEFAARFVRNTANAAQTPSSPMYWSDSYSVDGQCYCDTNFDHDLDQVSVATPEGSRSVIQVCADITSRFGSGRSSGRTYYNTVQCGHQPANSAADERTCPGFLTDSSGAIQNYNCSATGATWNLETLYSGSGDSGNTDSGDNGGSGNNGGHPSCQAAAADPDGDGFGWENNATCVVDASSGPGSENTGGGSGGHSVCSSASSDPDGDGYGWENGATCVVQAGGNNNGNDNDGNGTGSGLTACTQSGSDPDGDGYGWENGQSCLASSSDSGRDDNTASSGSPVCASAGSDSDGDGYGWENNQTCIVQ